MQMTENKLSVMPEQTKHYEERISDLEGRNK